MSNGRRRTRLLTVSSSTFFDRLPQRGHGIAPGAALACGCTTQQSAIFIPSESLAHWVRAGRSVTGLGDRLRKARRVNRPWVVCEACLFFLEAHAGVADSVNLRELFLEERGASRTRHAVDLQHRAGFSGPGSERGGSSGGGSNTGHPDPITRERKPDERQSSDQPKRPVVPAPQRSAPASAPRLPNLAARPQGPV